VISEVDLFLIDTIPGRSGIIVDAQLHDDGSLARLRFQAQRLSGAEVSDWSGWFDYAGEPIMLTWSAFWPEPERKRRRWFRR
jgi:hypothetical protein